VVLRVLLTLLGGAAALLPAPLLRLLCWALGGIFFHCHRPRRSLLCRNLALALPQLGPRERRTIARQNASRLVELGLFSLAAPFLSRNRIRKQFSLRGPWQSVVQNLRRGDRPQLLLIPHQTLSEALTFLPFLLAIEEEKLPVAILYRPFASRPLEAFVRRTRERFGLRLLPRKRSLGEAAALLRSGGCVGLLFDQNAGNAGAQSLLCGRVVSSSPLPELFHSRGTATLWMAAVERTGPFRGTLTVEPLPAAPGTATAAVDLWLEGRLERDGAFRGDWLWSHGRWKRPASKILSPTGRRDALPQALALRSLGRLPRRFPVAIRLPKSSADWQPIPQLLSAIREGRPDAHITLLCPAHLHAIARKIFPEADTIAPTVRSSGPFELYFTLSQSHWAGLEALSTPLRVGIGPRRRRLLTHCLPSADRRHLAPLGLPSPDPN
jgi:lauroyl/myristoyl acyltransferase